LIFGVDAINTLEGRKSHNNPKCLKRSAESASSNIARAMRSDPFWK
jgi:hypothetical protein